MYLKSSAAQDIGFDENKKCLHPERPGSELTFRVNPTSQKVLMTIVKNDGNWWVKDLFLDKCTVVDDQNWECRDKNGLGVVMEYAMVHGRYYHSLTGGGPPEYYSSSISGMTFLGVYYGLMDLPGYSARALSGFCVTATFNYALWQGTTPCSR